MSWQWAAVFALALIVALFGVASTVERGRWPRAAQPRVRRRAYTLALGVYCSSWTFYGTVGSLVRDGWNYLPIYLAPIILLLAAPRFLGRLARAVADEQATTISDFLAARFGHDVIVARLVTVIALCGTIPYVALQLRSIGSAVSLVSDRAVEVPGMIIAAGVLALFAMLFGARRFELAGRSEGLLYAISLESQIKLLALLAIAGLSIWLLIEADPATVAAGAARLRARFTMARLDGETATIMVISSFALLVLPRQFYMGLVEARDPDDLVRARLGLAGYIAIMALLAVPIALAGLVLLPAGVAPDIYVLELPAEHGRHLFLALALLGGIAAAASMVIVDATALATMVSNDLIFPTLLRADSEFEAGGLGRRLLLVRRLSIVGVVTLALAWSLLLSPRNSLASIGLVAFAAMAQFSPHLVLAALAGPRDALAARVSLAMGLALWLYTLALPPVLPPSWLASLAGTLLDPLRLGQIGHASPLVHGVCWSLGVNLAAYGLVWALRARRKPAEGLWRGAVLSTGRPVSDIGDLHRLVAGFVGGESADRELPASRHGQPIDRATAQRAQELIARVVGVSSARALVASALAGGQMDLDDVTRLLDAGAQSLRFSQPLLAATFENVDAGISVVDAEMNLVAWNTRYLDLFDYPPGLVRVGTPVADLIRHNARHGDFGTGSDELHVAKRLDHMRRGQRHSFERRRHDGRVIRTNGGPMPGGGYVMSFTDVTEEARVRAELERTLAELESRVAERTQALSQANLRLAAATRDKTRFLAAASHDLLQPLHAARLFTAALARDPATARADLVARVDRSIAAGESLLRALLDISRLDAGGLEPQAAPVALAPFLTELAESLRPMAAEQGLELRLGPLPGTLLTDPGLLRSIIQNFLTNALRYTELGGVVLGVRRRGAEWRIDVIDTGVGIAPERQEDVFAEFTRLGEVDAEGLGLGLAIARRIAGLLGGRIELASRPGRGSRFSLLLPASDQPAPASALPAPPSAIGNRALTILAIDDDPEIVEATVALLASLGHSPRGAGTLAEALALADGIDAVLADYRLSDPHLADAINGLELIARLREGNPALPALLLTADVEPALMARAQAAGIEVVAKPADPARIAAFLDALATTQPLNHQA